MGVSSGHWSLTIHRRTALRLRNLEERLTPAAGVLDASFNATGQLLFGVPGASVTAGRAIAVDAAGRAVVVGFATLSGNDDFLVARFATDGSIDKSFNGVGYIT